MPFRNREHAARELARRLQACKGQNPLILAIPRGAVPMGKILADSLGGELDVVLVHKLGAPGNPEYAIGAVSESGQTVLRLSAEIEGLSSAWVDEEKEWQIETLRRRRARYTPERPPVDPRDRLVIVVDDGIATGATFKAALSVVRARRPRKLIAAVAVAPQASLEEIRRLADEVVCLETPPLFFAVSQFFAEFPQVDDDEVIELLRASRGAPVLEMEKP
jgi:putative phosphoribosyl transferase